MAWLLHMSEPDSFDMTINGRYRSTSTSMSQKEGFENLKLAYADPDVTNIRFWNYPEQPGTGRSSTVRFMAIYKSSAFDHTP
jgi:hypothetical protein